MTRYTVVWLRAAQNQLAEIWLAAENRQAISDAADFIDAELMIDATSKGSILAENLRVLDAPPIQVLFRVSKQDRLAEVTRVRPS